MRNRAKCKKCESIIESFHVHDYVQCKCGAIAIDGGSDYLKIIYDNIDDFLRIDDEGNEIVVKLGSKETKELINDKPMDKWPVTPSRSDLLHELDAMIENIDKLPQQAMSLPITHYDLSAALTLLSLILRLEDD